MIRKKVAVAISGGVDSSVAAFLLKEQGFEVSGFFMRNWSPIDEINNECPWQKDYEDVRRVCRHLGIPYASFNFEREYKERVLQYFLDEYQAGRTPNPDVACNREIKFDLFAKKARALGFDYIATGHYAKLVNGKLVKPKDSEKNQTYFLCHLKPEQLENVLFPLGDLTKSEVREVAKNAGIPTALKKDSQGICFIGKIPVRDFLKQNLKLEPGTVISSTGEVLGNHEGSQLYTRGQRHIGVSTGGIPLYVVSTDAKTNTVTLADENNLYSNELSFINSVWQENLPKDFDCEVQIRYRTPLIKARVEKSGKIVLEKEVKAITPGQYVAFYKNSQLLGGAVIN